MKNGLTWKRETAEFLASRGLKEGVNESYLDGVDMMLEGFTAVYREGDNDTDRLRFVESFMASAALLVAEHREQ